MTLADKIESWRGKLKLNWDSYFAEEVADVTIDKAKQLAPLMEQFGMTCVAPTTDGGIEFSDDDTSVWITIVVEVGNES